MGKTKKDISKELMFNKLMPTGLNKGSIAPNVKQTKPYEPFSESESSSTDNVEKEIESTESNSVDKIKSNKEIELDNTAKKEDDARILETNNDKKNEDAAVIENDSTENSIETVKQKDEISEIPEEKKKNIPENDNNCIIVINIYEPMVEQKLDEALEKFNCCKCTLCRQDVTAIALNNLPPKYTIVAKCDIDKVIDNIGFSETTKAIMKAILYVKKNPRH